MEKAEAMPLLGQKRVKDFMMVKVQNLIVPVR